MLGTHQITCFVLRQVVCILYHPIDTVDKVARCHPFEASLGTLLCSMASSTTTSLHRRHINIDLSLRKR